MTPEQRSRISAMGGRACQALGKAHRFIEGSEKAKEAGRKGGRIRQMKPRAEVCDA
jgi:general stress protein YciG